MYACAGTGTQAPSQIQPWMLRSSAFLHVCMCRYWYTRGKSGPAVSVEEERRAVKQKEEELMLEVRFAMPLRAQRR